MLTFIKKQSLRFKLVLIAVLLFILTVALGIIHHHISTIGASVGAFNGQIVGTALGSARGVTEGIAQGAQAGTQAGLSAEDTIVQLQNSMESIAKLEVLKANVTLHGRTEVGKEYEGTILVNADAVFTIDLNQADIHYNPINSELIITIPQPELSLNLDRNTIQVLTEKQKWLRLSVDAEDTFDAWTNTIKKIEENAQDSIIEYDYLYDLAKKASSEQIKLLSNALSDTIRSTTILFKEDSK